MATASAPPGGPRLLQQAEKILLSPIHAHLIAYCPTMDLIALVTSEENLDVYRINGQRAFGLKRKSEDVVVQSICWQFNGLAVAVCWSDGACDVVGSETGKVVHRDVRLLGSQEEEGGMDYEEEERKVVCMGWGLNFIDVERVIRRTGGRKDGDGKKVDEKGTSPAGAATRKTTIDLNAPTTEDWDAFKDDTSLEDFLQRQPDFETLDIAPDLPDQLAMMDMESLLPKLPPIPLPPANPFMMMRGAQADAGAFSSQAQVDGLLHSHHLRDHNSVDMFIRCTDKGSVHPSIYDSMETVDIRLPEAWNMQSRPLAHTSHPYACTHGLLMEVKTPADKQKKIAYVPLTLGFIPSAGIYLHLIASKTAQLQNLLSYLTHTLSRIRSYFTHSQDLPSKFMRNISETLSEHGQGGLVESLYHLACTGHCLQPIHEWLVDELAEQGHKRWDNAVISGTSMVIQLLHENFLPAIDRCSIVISRLSGLAEYHDRGWIFSGPLSDFSALLDQLKSLRLLAHTTLLYAADEKRSFASFSKWLRYSIDFEATEADSQSRAEMEQKDPGVDVGVVLSYIEHNMAHSDLAPYLKSVKELGGVREASYDATVKAIALLREGASVDENALCVEGVLSRFSNGVRGLLRQVSQWQEENVSMECGIVLETGEAADAEFDMRMIHQPLPPQPSTDIATDSIATYIALLAPSTTTTTATTTPSTLTIHRLTHTPHLTTPPPVLASTCLTTPEHRILDAKFADDITLLLLLQTTTTTSSSSETKTNILLSLPYTPSASASPTIITYNTTTTTVAASTHLPHGCPLPDSLRTHVTLSPAVIHAHTRHVFEGRFTPLKLIVNGRKGRRVVVVLGSDRKHYRVLDLDFKDRERGARREEEEDGAGKGEHEDADDSEWSGDSDVEMGGA